MREGAVLEAALTNIEAWRALAEELRANGNA